MGGDLHDALVVGITVAASPRPLLVAAKLMLLAPAPVKASISGAPASTVTEVGKTFPASVTLKDRQFPRLQRLERGRRDRPSYCRDRPDRREDFKLRKKGREKRLICVLQEKKCPGVAERESPQRALSIYINRSRRHWPENGKNFARPAIFGGDFADFAGGLGLSFAGPYVESPDCALPARGN